MKVEKTLIDDTKNKTIKIVRSCSEDGRKYITKKCLKLAPYWKKEEGKIKEIVEEWNTRGYGRKRSRRMSGSTEWRGSSEVCKRDRVYIPRYFWVLF